MRVFGARKGALPILTVRFGELMLLIGALFV